jgi:hypothetical protein
MSKDLLLGLHLAFQRFRRVLLGKMGQGGGREFAVDKIGEGVGKIGHGGGRKLIINEGGETAHLIGQGGRRERMVQ